jgi:large subunit ribosomal protein L5
MKSHLQEHYSTTVRDQLITELGYTNVMQVPRVSKVVVNIGVKDAVSDNKVINGVKDILTMITGQAAVTTKAKKSIASFKLREGMPIGVMVTLRSDRMYHFLEKLINAVLPAVRDFQGVSPKFDGKGNYNLGLKDWMVFPEIDYDTAAGSRGLNITIQTTAKTDAEAYALLKAFGMPFRKKS